MGKAVAIAIGTCVSMLIIAAVCTIVPLAILLRNSPPDIPCYWAAVVNTTLKPKGQPVRWSVSKMYLDGTSSANIQQNLSTYGPTVGASRIHGGVMAFEEEHFGRELCSLIPTKQRSRCWSLSVFFSRDCKNCECPNDALKKCDLWSCKYTGGEIERFWLDSTSALPMKYELLTADEITTMTFLAIDTSPFDTSVFQTAAPSKCNDMTWAASSARSTQSEIVNDEAVIAEINTKAKTWKAGKNKFFDGMTLEDSQKLLRKPSVTLKPQASSLRQTRAHISPRAIPTSFDSRVQWPACVIDHTRNQMYCGGCYAFAGAKTFEDRYCISHGSKVLMSPMYILDCHTRQQACGGGYTDLLWEDLVATGLTSESCLPTPYSVSADACPSKCSDGVTSIPMYKASSAYGVFVAGNRSATVQAIQQEIMDHGPVEVNYWVFDDFMRYESGIYTLTAGSVYSGGHAVTLVGWGTDAGVPYWIVVNSWGSSWGESGSFRIRRGTNECSIEDMVAAGLV